MAKWRWAALWKRAAKRQRRKADRADRYFTAWIKAIVQLDWRGRQARAWKAAAKRWRRKALAYETMLYNAHETITMLYCTEEDNG